MRYNWITVVMGLWLIVAPFVLGYSSVRAAMFNDVILGVGVALTAYLATLPRLAGKAGQ